MDITISERAAKVTPIKPEIKTELKTANELALNNPMRVQFHRYALNIREDGSYDPTRTQRFYIANRSEVIFHDLTQEVAEKSARAFNLALELGGSN